MLAGFALVVGTAGAAVLPALRSPSGNIRCVFASPADDRNGGGLFCTIGHASYAAALQAKCLERGGVDWHGFSLTARGKGASVCTGGALWFRTPHYVTVAYGHTWRAGPYTCRSALTGVTCTTGAGTHGLFISRESWRGW